MLRSRSVFETECTVSCNDGMQLLVSLVQNSGKPRVDIQLQGLEAPTLPACGFQIAPDDLMPLILSLHRMRVLFEESGCSRSRFLDCVPRRGTFKRHRINSS